jgi:hypothetical protein
MHKGKIAIAALVLALVGAATAGAVRDVEKVHIRAGDIVIDGQGGFKPETLPKFEDAPISIYGGGKISTVSGDLPPILRKLIFEFDRHGSVVTKGLPTCSQPRLVATTVATARKLCPGAIIGKGFGKGIAKFAEQPPIPASSKITLFNGPRKHGNPTLFAHAHLTVPAPTTLVIPVEIEKINKGVYGYRTEADIPCIASCHVYPISGWVKIKREWNFKGKRYSYINARCETGHLQARGEFVFRDKFDIKKDGDTLFGTFFRPCKVRGE